MKQELYQFDETFLPQETLKEIADSLPTPFYLYDEHGIRKQVQRFFQAFHWVPEYRQFFPVSLAPLPGLLKILREEGCGVCCSSLAELLMAERCGFSGVQILYTPFFPDAQACEKMRDLKAGLVLDNMASADFVLLNGYLPDRVSLRYHPSEYSPGSHTRVNLSRMLLGMPKNELLNLAKVLQDAGVQQLGLSIQLTKQCSDRKLYATAADLLLNLAKELRQIGVEVSFCDLGGGIGLGFLPEERDLDPVDVSSSLEAYLDEKVPEWFRKMALAGAKLMVLPAAFNTTTGPVHWDITMQARAVDNQVYFAANAPALDEKGIFKAYGNSCIVSPWAEFVAHADDSECIIYGDIDTDYVDSVRQQLPLLAHRRPELY